MKTTFCDHCDNPMGSYGQARITDNATLDRVGPLEITITAVKYSHDKNMKIGEPDLCRDCILHAVKQLMTEE